MLRSGLVSITFRTLEPAAIVELVTRAGLDAIEWGGDVHVPHGDTRRAASVRDLTEAAGIAVAAYGSYYRVAVAQELDFDAVLNSAAALGAPLIRVWAGDRGSADADAAYRDRVAGETRELAQRAAEHGMELAYEFHSGTLTDTAESAAALLRAVGERNVLCYWQPPLELDLPELQHSLDTVLPWLANLHVFHWSANGHRCNLEQGRKRWTTLLAQLRRAPARNRYAMIEFVRGDEPEQFLDDARALSALLAAPAEEGS